MILRLFALCFGCHHHNRSRIFSDRPEHGSRTWQVCLTCGAEREYAIGQKPGRWSK
jgi:hypothetical protein